MFYNFFMNQIHYLFLGGGFLIIGLFVFFFGFSPSPKTPLETAVSAVADQQSQKTALISLEKTENTDEYALIVHNPAKKPIQSVQLFLGFSSEILSVSNLHLPENPVLELAFAGNGFGIDSDNGLIRITTAYAGKATDGVEKFPVALITIKKQDTSSPAFLSFPLQDQSKTQQIITLENGKMINILDTEKIKNFVIQ